jgi:protein-L-isoaspartate(D-aspartate) O-methyltransferase
MGFYHDRPVVFLETPSGGIKTISAPHMIATLLHNLELDSGQHIVIYGAKGGYISALVAHIVGESGHVTVLDPSIEVINYISNNLRGYPTVDCHTISELSDVKLPKLNRVLVTGQIHELPEWLSDGIEDGGFAIAPIGNMDAQRLLKLEKQGDSLFETDLGSVIFGPVDIDDTIVGTPSPEEMAELVEQVVELMSDIGIIEQDDRSKLYDLVAELRLLPDDLPPPEELDDPSQHPMMQLILQKGEWFVKLWPMIQSMIEPRIASYASPENTDQRDNHSDFIP